MAIDEQLDVEATLTVKDDATVGLKRVAGQAEGLAKKFDNLISRAASFTATFGGLAGAFSLHSAVQSGRNYLDQIDRINKLTGISANRVAGMTEAFEEAGVPLEDVENIFVKIGKKQNQVAQGNKTLGALAKRYGMSLKDGPEKTLEKMAGLVDKGKIGAAQVGQLLGVQGKALTNTMDLLRNGAQGVNKLIAEGRAKNAHITDSSVGGVDSMSDALGRVSRSWRRIATIILVNIAPGIEKLANFLEKRVDGWAEGAKKFGKFLSDHMDEAITLARTFGRIMMANFVVSKLTGTGLGTTIQRGLAAAGKGGGIGGAVRAAALGGGGGALGSLANFLPAMRGFGSVVLRAVPMLLRLSPWLLLAAVTAKIIADNWEVVRQEVQPVFDRIKRIWANLQDIGSRIATIFKSVSSALSNLFGGNSALMKGLRWWVSNAMNPFNRMLYVVEKITQAFKNILWGIQSLLAKLGIGEDPAKEMAREFEEQRAERGSRREAAENAFFAAAKKGRATQQMFDELVESTRAFTTRGQGPYDLINKGFYTREQERLLARFRANSNTSSPAVYQDFRGSRFEINQAFAEGFDPDRIAVGFANDLAALGERGLQSGLSPAFTVR